MQLLTVNAFEDYLKLLNEVKGRQLLNVDC
jgi:hypothetical protein